MVKTGSNRQWNGDPDQRSQIRYRQRFEDGLVERYKVPKGTQFTIHGRDYMPREKTMKPYVLILSLCVLLAGAPVLAQQKPMPSETREANFKAYVQLLRKDLQKEKVNILTEMMEFTPEEAARFWPLYNAYDKALTKLADERIAFIRMYSDNYTKLSDDMTNKIANGAMDLEIRRVNLHRQYYQEMSKALSVRLAARFLQIETQIEKIVDLQIAAGLPVVE